MCTKRSIKLNIKSIDYEFTNIKHLLSKLGKFKITASSFKCASSCAEYFSEISVNSIKTNIRINLKRIPSLKSYNCLEAVKCHSTAFRRPSSDALNRNQEHLKCLEFLLK